MNMAGSLEYSKPEVTDLGLITQHTFPTGLSGHFKGGGNPQHLDKKCEWSGGSDDDLCSAPATGA